MQSACPGGYNLVQRQASVFQIVVVVFQSGNRGILYNYYTKTTCDGSSRQKRLPCSMEHALRGHPPHVQSIKKHQSRERESASCACARVLGWRGGWRRGGGGGCCGRGWWCGCCCGCGCWCLGHGGGIIVIHGLGHFNILVRHALTFMSGQGHVHDIVHIEPFGMMIHLFRQQGRS